MSFRVAMTPRSRDLPLPGVPRPLQVGRSAVGRLSVGCASDAARAWGAVAPGLRPLGRRRRWRNSVATPLKGNVRREKANHDLALAAHAELSIQPLQMRVHCVPRDAEPLRDYRLALVIDDAPRDLGFALREAQRLGDCSPLSRIEEIGQPSNRRPCLNAAGMRRPNVVRHNLLMLVT